MNEMKEKYQILRFYKMEKNDNLMSIERKMKVPISLLKAANENIVFARGVTIIIPKTNYKLYEVKPSDTIQSICQEFKLEKGAFYEVNDIKYVYPGMTVFI